MTTTMHRGRETDVGLLGGDKDCHLCHISSADPAPVSLAETPFRLCRSCYNELSIAGEVREYLHYAQRDYQCRLRLQELRWTPQEQAVKDAAAALERAEEALCHTPENKAFEQATRDVTPERDKWRRRKDHFREGQMEDIAASFGVQLAHR